MAHITLLPVEILVLIAYFLEKSDLSATTRTCRQLQRVLTPYLWKTFVLRSSVSGKFYDIDALATYAPWVRSLEYTGAPPSEYYNIVYPNLDALRVNFCTMSKDHFIDKFGMPQQNNDYSTLIRLNPTIKHLYVNPENLATTSAFWTTVFTTLKNPRCLDFHDFQVLQADALDSFWKACTRFEEISVSGHGFANSNILPTVSFSRLQHLTVDLRAHYSSRTPAGGNMEWFRMCPNLTKMHINNRYSEFPIEPFAKALEQQTWTQLTDLALTGSGGSDARFSLIARHLPPLEHFQHESTGFGPQSFVFLQQQLFENIRTLNMQGCYGLVSRMILDILTGCPLLEVFKAFSISVSDLRSHPEPWTCLGLKHLEVFFSIDPTRPDDGELAFEHLSRLERLETLDVNARHTWTLAWDIFSRMKRQGSLQWRLDSGLQHLSTLKRLKTLVIDSSFHDARMEDVQWMLDQWPALEKLRCGLSQDPVTRKRFMNLFEQHNIDLEPEDGWRSML
ncbi:hypothetical protein BGZ96_004152 [Linnemannia gamsii]|uniref:F-box domain-containing protein n=1 Tax=Linnemannia gamsii TaxID=64522 RepID=A0ABQ7K6P5_9FUNG|nr:hypothetical protein BGZ96_004152 [Linnemannia gamsii]